MTLTGTSLLDVQSAACLAGGPARVVDTALAVLVESGRVRVRHDGMLTVRDRRSRDEVESAVLDAIGTRGYRTAGLVRHRAATDVRLTRVVDRLVAAGLLAPRRRGGTAPTRAGRRVVRQLRRTVPPDGSGGSAALQGVPAGTSAAAVAVHGPDAMPDAELRAALFESSRPQRLRRRGAAVDGRRRAADVAATASLHDSSPHRHGAGGWGAGGWGGGGWGGDFGGGGCGDGGGGGSSC